MTMLAEEDRTEYASLTSWAREAERTAQRCWNWAMIAALTILSWGTVSQNSALMLPVVVAVAAGFYAMLRGRQQVSSIAAYVEECEGQGTEPSWFTRLARFRTAQGFNPAGDWIAVCLANAVVLLSIVFAWLFAETAWQGELMSGIVTGCGIVFAFHSITETSRLPRADAAASHWRQSNPRGASRRDRAVGE